MLAYPSYGSRREYASQGAKRYDSGSIAWAWASKQSERGKCPASMTFEGDKFYSYGTCVAERVTYNGQTVFLVSTENYSSTTARHLGDVRSAVRGRGKVFHVPGVRTGSSDMADADRILTSWQTKAGYVLKTAADSRDPKKTRLILEAHGIVLKMQEYAAFFELSLAEYPVAIPLSDELIEQASERIAEWQKKADDTRAHNREVREKLRPVVYAAKRLGGPDVEINMKALIRTYESINAQEQLDLGLSE
jgi:hypothetical protein